MNRCEACDVDLPDDDDCTTDGECAKLAAVGAIEVTVAVGFGPYSARMCPLFIRGGWLCSTCAARYLAKKGEP